MTRLNAKEIWQMPKEKFVSLLENGAFSPETQTINFFAPSFVHYKNKFFCSSQNSFPSISVTGSSCALNCKHCNKKVLNTMTPVNSPKDLFDVCKKLKNDGTQGCLISGGCGLDGSVPLTNFIDAFKKIKTELDLKLSVHTGLVDFITAEELKKAGVDSVLIDVIGSDETIKEIYNLDVTVTVYEKSLKALQDSEIPFIPHVLVGLHYGHLKGEFKALNLIAKYSPSAVIIIAFIPIRGTPMENVEPPEPADIIRTLVCAKLLMPTVPVVLGCMRPKGEHRKITDVFAVKAGVDAIAFPVEDAIQTAQSLNLEMLFSSVCCSQIYELNF
ncbi:MAG: radical SAM protein [Candidatus Bathyarchaeota archaeon]|nr:radical SAM protein [Candidatus Bathyarchaeum tardum]WNZ29699.1 MAG: radical SAM protein [Candidatus Bathyarchaeota archaeon]